MMATKLKTVEDAVNDRLGEEDKLRIWNAVSKTDPAHTKAVEFGRKFTAIDAHYQIQEATRLFGPIGEGWGYQTGDIAFVDGLVIVPVTLWHGARDQSFGPIYGSTTLRDRKGNLDKDAPKKATTDALTKALSQLGFNADVFLGKFDDNKYVEQVRQEFHPKSDPTDGGGIDPALCFEIADLAPKVGKTVGEICAAYSVEDLADLSTSQATACIKRLKSLVKEPA